MNYPIHSSWNTNQIFSTAYKDNYDYILLIDQVAKFTIDKRTKVGGKYQIRSYDIKSANPDWLDLGQLTCNMSIKPSIQKFASQIVSKMVPNYKPSQTFIDDTEDLAVNTTYVPSDKLKTSSELDTEIEKLKIQLKIEKEKADKALEEKKELEAKYKDLLDKEKQKSELAIANFEALKKTKAYNNAEQLRKENEIRRQKELAESYTKIKEEILKREAEETLKNPKPKVSISKELTREEILIQRKEAKRKTIEERAIKRKEAQQATAKRIEDRKKLVEAKREEQKRIRAELEKKRQDQKLLANAKRQERLKITSQARLEEKLNSTEKQQITKQKIQDIQVSTEINSIPKDDPIDKNNINKKVPSNSRFEKDIIEKQKLLLKERLEKEKLKEERRLAKLENEEKKKKQKELEKTQKIEKQLTDKKKKKASINNPEVIAKVKTSDNKAHTIQSNEDKHLSGFESTETKRTLKTTSNSKQKLTIEEKRLEQEKREVEEFERKKQIKEQKRLAKVKSGKDIELFPKTENSEIKNLNNSFNKAKYDTNSILLIIRGNQKDKEILKDLQDNLVLELLLKKVKSTSFILNNEEDFDQKEIIDQNKSIYKLIVIINQKSNVANGIFSYKISTFDYINSTWNNYDPEPYNITKRRSFKSLTKKIINKL